MWDCRGRWEPFTVTVATVLLVLYLTATGIGSVLGWSVRLTFSQLAAIGGLFVRALPVVLLTVLVFFNTYVWIMSSIISDTRLSVALALLVLVAAMFVISGTLDAARPTMQSATASPRHAERLDGTPFEEMADPPEVDSLTLGARFNVVFVLMVSEIVQITMVAVVSATLFFALGLILLSPQLLAAWAPHGSPESTLLDLTVPVPQALIETTLFIGALTFMYISAHTVADGAYRSRFLEPVIQDLKLTLLARNRYRHATPVYDSAGQGTVARAGATLDAPDGRSALIQLMSWIHTPSPSGPRASRAAAIAQSDSRNGGS
jgi:hypothetical protein